MSVDQPTAAEITLALLDIKDTFKKMFLVKASANYDPVEEFNIPRTLLRMHKYEDTTGTSVGTNSSNSHLVISLEGDVISNQYFIYSALSEFKRRHPKVRVFIDY